VTHRTIKTINGRQYLYEQTSTRIAGQVKTFSTYICPISDATYSKASGVNGMILLSNGDILPPIVNQKIISWEEQDKKIRQKYQDQKTNTRQKIKNVFDEKPAPAPAPAPAPKNTVTTQITKKKLNLTPKTNISVYADLAKYNISEKGVRKEAGRIFKICHYLELPTSDFPKIKIVKGSKFGFNPKSLFGGGSVLTIPKPRGYISKLMSKPYDRRKKVNRGLAKTYKIPKSSHRNQFYTAYSKALSSSLLSHMQKHDEKRYKQLEQAFEAQFKAKNTAIISFMKRTSKSYAQTLWYRATGQVTQYYQAKRKPEFLGLSDWQARTSWKDDFEGLASDILKNGYNDVLGRYKGDVLKVQRSIEAKHRKKASLTRLERWSGKAKAIDKKIGDDTARMNAIKASLEQLRALHLPFYKVGKRGGAGF